VAFAGKSGTGRSKISSAAHEQIEPDKLARQLEEYFAVHPAAAVLEEGRILFDMRTARYSITDSHGRCLLQLWSEERNLMRTVVGMENRAQSLRILTRKMGAPKPQTLEIVASSDRRTPTTREAARRNYQHLLERALTRTFLGYKVDGLRNAMDLENSFGPAYVRGHLLKGTSAEAVIGVGQEESGAIIDGILTLGILWLDYCRQHADTRRHFNGLKVIVPHGAFRTTSERMAWLNHAAANFELYTLDERSEELTPVDFRDTGNTTARLVQSFSVQTAVERCQTEIDQIFALLPPGSRERTEIQAKSSSEVALALHGLEFARIRRGFAANSFTQQNEITFGAGPHETPLNEETTPLARELFARLFASRHPNGDRKDPLFRIQSERWLESRLRHALPELLPGLRGELIYSQVPALSSNDRGMLDILTIDRNGRLVVMELKANEDLHLPMQSLDYWIRVRALNADRPTGTDGKTLSAFERNNYFDGAPVSPLPPRLLLAAPALRIHPANEPVLRYLSPEIEWELIALNEHWRQDLSIVFRKRSDSASTQNAARSAY
jgi:hypothetical protein